MTIAFLLSLGSLISLSVILMYFFVRYQVIAMIVAFVLQAASGESSGDPYAACEPVFMRVSNENIKGEHKQERQGRKSWEIKRKRTVFNLITRRNGR